eukprot:Rmarinus@m.4656
MFIEVKLRFISTLGSLPIDVLVEIFSRLSCVRTLSNVAMVNREWNRLTSDDGLQQLVRLRFLEKHKRNCPRCREPWTSLRPQHALCGGSLDCLLYIDYTQALGVDQIYLCENTVEAVLRSAIRLNHRNVVRFVVKRLGLGVLRSLGHDTALHLAVRYEHPSMLRFLVSQMGLRDLCFVGDLDGKTILHYLFRSYSLSYRQMSIPNIMSMLQYVLEELALTDLCWKEDKNGHTPLYDAILNRNHVVLQYLVEKRELVSLCNDRDLFYLAVEKRYCNLVELLGKHLQPENLRCKVHGETVLHAAARLNLPGLVQYFVEEKGLGDMLYEPNVAGESVVSICLAQGHFSVLHHLVKNSDEVGLVESCCTKDKDGNPPLHRLLRRSLPAGENKMNTLRFIREKGLTKACMERDNGGNTVLHVALELNSVDCIKVLRFFIEEMGLVELCGTANLKGETIFHKAAQRSSAMDALKYLIDEKNLRNYCYREDREGNTILHAAAQGGQRDILKYLTRDVGLKDLFFKANKKGDTLLHLAPEAMIYATQCPWQGSRVPFPALVRTRHKQRIKSPEPTISKDAGYKVVT